MAATITVTSLADDGGPGEIRSAISTANASSGSTITFKSGLSGTVTLTSGLPPITASVTINGPGEASIAIDGANLYRPFVINNSSATVNIEAIAIQNGSAGRWRRNPSVRRYFITFKLHPGGQ